MVFRNIYFLPHFYWFWEWIRCLTLFRMGKKPPSLKSVMMMKLDIVIPYLKKIKKIYESRDTPPEFCWHQHFFSGNQQILLYQKIQIHIAFWYIISNSFNFSWVSKDYLIIFVNILMMPGKMATWGLLKITVFWKKGHDIIIPVNDVTNKILSCDSNYIVDVFMRSKFDKSSISMKEVLTTSIL